MVRKPFDCFITYLQEKFWIYKLLYMGTLRKEMLVGQAANRFATVSMKAQSQHYQRTDTKPGLIHLLDCHECIRPWQEDRYECVRPVFSSFLGRVCLIESSPIKKILLQYKYSRFFVFFCGARTIICFKMQKLVFCDFSCLHDPLRGLAWLRRKN